VVFSSLTFIFRFLPIFLIIYYAVPFKFKNYVLLLGSLCFYAYGEPKYLILILFSVIVNYIAALFMEKSVNHKARKNAWFILSLIYNLGILFFFKYINFVLENLNYIIGGLGRDPIPLLSSALPLGISFYTFQIVSYVIDVYKGETVAEKSFLRLGMYLSMFPQLISGPIVKYSDISIQLENRSCNLRNLEKGMKLFTIGLCYKVLVADRIGTLWHDIQTIGFESISTPLAWLGIIGYSIQLYFDFYGYSLMAIGAGRMLGFVLPDNFNDPYISKSVSEFWRRWHMSLGKWFKDYVYIPLGGNRKGVIKLVFNLFIVWMLTGLWHGASWNFILWGIALFFFICIEKLFLKRLLDNTKVISRIYLLFAMTMTWTLFAISKLSDIKNYYGRLFSFTPGINVNTHDFIKYFGIYKLYFIIGIFLCLPFAREWYKKHENSIPCIIILFGLFWYAIYQLANSINNPFLYFKF
jgi:alginate O-acetyltransferase complex protein AlgI